MAFGAGSTDQSGLISAILFPVEEKFKNLLTNDFIHGRITKLSQDDRKLPMCRSGEIGRRPGLKIPWEKSRAGSIPVSGTKFNIAE